jgi:16S rRNA (guanine527-N7)-methyltransferase
MNKAWKIIEQVLQPFSALDQDHLQQMQDFLQLVMEVNQKTNLTAITDWKKAVVKHLYDSLIVMQWAQWPRQAQILDLGSGAGFPGIPLAISNPLHTYYLLEANQKKAAFLDLAIESLKLKNVFVLNERAENLAHQPPHRGGYKIVTARAVAATAVLLELAIPFCQMGGWFIAYKSSNYQQEVVDAKNATEILGTGLRQEFYYELPEALGSRALLFFQKDKQTPERYPRRPGLPGKRPL